MALGVYSKPRKPSGPVRHRKMVSTRPTTTGGSPMPVFTRERSSRRPRNWVSPMSAPSGTPVSTAIAVAAPLTTSDATAASITSGSSAASLATAPAMPWTMRSI